MCFKVFSIYLFFILVSSLIYLHPVSITLKTHFQIIVTNYGIFCPNVDSDGTELNIVKETSPLHFFYSSTSTLAENFRLIFTKMQARIEKKNLLHHDTRKNPQNVFRFWKAKGF